MLIIYNEYGKNMRSMFNEYNDYILRCKGVKLNIKYI
jgi:hypothetical protein